MGRKKLDIVFMIWYSYFNRKKQCTKVHRTRFFDRRKTMILSISILITIIILILLVVICFDNFNNGLAIRESSSCKSIKSSICI
jgi:hypothetical protein